MLRVDAFLHLTPLGTKWLVLQYEVPIVHPAFACICVRLRVLSVIERVRLCARTCVQSHVRELPFKVHQIKLHVHGQRS